MFWTSWVHWVHWMVRYFCFTTMSSMASELLHHGYICIHPIHHPQGWQRKYCCANIAQEGCCKHKDLMTMWHVYRWTFTCNYYIKTPPYLQKRNKHLNAFHGFWKNNIQHNTIIPTALNLSFRGADPHKEAAGQLGPRAFEWPALRRGTSLTSSPKLGKIAFPHSHYVLHLIFMFLQVQHGHLVDTKLV